MITFPNLNVNQLDIVENKNKLGLTSYTRGIVVQYQHQGAGIGIKLWIVKNLLYPIPNQYQHSAYKAAIRKWADLCQLWTN